MTSLKKFRENTFMKAVVIPLIITITVVILFFFSLPSFIDSIPNAETYTAEQSETVDEGGETVG